LRSSVGAISQGVWFVSGTTKGTFHQYHGLVKKLPLS
jgi:hypothetical protein